MKYSILICTLLFTGIAYGQTELRNERMVPTTKERGNDSRARIQSLTDIEINGGELLRSQFNTAQQSRLDNAGEIQRITTEKRERVRALIENRTERWEENKIRLSNLRNEIVRNKIESITNRFDTAIERLVRIDAKIQTFITTDTPDEIVLAFNEAHALFEEARVSIDIMSNQLEIQTRSTDGFSLEAIRELTMQGKEDVAAAWNAYIEVNKQLQKEFEGNNDTN